VVEKIGRGDLVLLYFNEARSYLISADGRPYSFNEGVVDSSKIIGEDYGSSGQTHLGERFILVKPCITDLIYRGFKRRTQVVYPKDAALMLLKTGIGPGCRVVEAGTGSGFLTAILAYYVRPGGKVYTYEVRRDFLELALENLSRAGLLDYVEARERDIRSGIEERDVDAVILDLPYPWQVLPEAFNALRHGGSLACFLPTINQVERTCEKASEVGFVLVEALELLERHYKVKGGETRPFQRMIGHTGYMVFARRP